MQEYIIEYINNHKKMIILIIVVIISLLLLNNYFNSSNTIRNNVKNYIVDKDFKLDDDKVLYEKVVSNNTYEEYENDIKNKNDSIYHILLFDIYSYQLVENLYSYDDGVNSFLSAAYDYRNEKLTYNYRVTYETANIIFRGNYDNNKFTCDSEYVFDANISGGKEYYCDLIEDYISEFKETSMELITSTKLLNDMKK